MSFAGLTPWSNGSALSRPIHRLAAEHARQSPDTFHRPWHIEIDPAAFLDALTRESKARMDRFLAGVRSYQDHPYVRTRGAPAAIWSKGVAALRDHGGDGPAAVFVPSLINRAYILDLAQDRSILAACAASGVRTFLLDWGEPGTAELKFTIDDYIIGVLIPALEHVKALTGQAPRLVGYCMGGTVCVAPAVLRPDLIAGLGLLAAPWDFHAESAASRAMIAATKPVLDAMIAAQGCASVDLLQALFASLDPTLVGRKFRGFAERSPDSDAARRFVELEDWLNDGIPLAADVARQCLFGWYGENQTLNGTWRVGGLAIDPRRIAVPSLALVPSQDRIVPPASAEALAKLIPNCARLNVDLGHIGMMAGGSAPQLVYEPLAKWLKSLA
ncbi:MAG: alpha/beta fold hydrolase [Rhodospirillaceae bacterium]|nr:alpha/beta fold hydrolase [Rhodospirillaceae bacterium]